MDIGIGLPGHIRGGIDGTTVVEWARRAEQRGFSTLAVSDRVVYTTPEPLVTLAAAAGATREIRLATGVLLGPLRTNHTLFAKQTATLDRIAGPGRLRLGVAPGLREDDFELTGVDFGARGRDLDSQLRRMKEVWGGDSRIGPAPATPGGPELMFGGMSAATLRRIREFGGGWVIGDCTADEFTEFAVPARQAWTEAAHPGELPTSAAVMFALGPDAKTIVDEEIRPYYAFIGEEWLQYAIDGAFTVEDDIRKAVAAFEAAGCHELVFTGNSADPEQVDLLADAVGL